MRIIEIVNLALLDSGIVGQGQTASAEDANNAFTRIKMLLTQWQRKRWLVWALKDVSCAITGAQSYTIGTGEDLDVARPDRLEEGSFFRQFAGTQAQVDYPLQLLKAREDYNQITVKRTGTWPSAIFYDNAYPVGVIYLWPVAQQGTGYELHVPIKTPIAEPAAITSETNLPPEYEPAIYYNLLVRLRAAYQMAPDPVMVALARESLNVLRGANTQIARLNMPASLSNRYSSYNVYSDNAGR